MRPLPEGLTRPKKYAAAMWYHLTVNRDSWLTSLAAHRPGFSQTASNYIFNLRQLAHEDTPACTILMRELLTEYESMGTRGEINYTLTLAVLETLLTSELYRHFLDTADDYYKLSNVLLAAAVDVDAGNPSYLGSCHLLLNAIANRRISWITDTPNAVTAVAETLFAPGFAMLFGADKHTAQSIQDALRTTSPEPMLCTSNAGKLNPSGQSVDIPVSLAP